MEENRKEVGAEFDKVHLVDEPDLIEKFLDGAHKQLIGEGFDTITSMQEDHIDRNVIKVLVIGERTGA